jgi:hypothetical protein
MAAMRSQYLLSLFLMLAAWGFPRQSADEKPSWHVDWPSAQRAAAREGKPIFAVLACKH